MTAAIYARVSVDRTDISEDQKSPQRQVDNAREYAAAKGVIYRGCEVAVVNADDPCATSLAHDVNRRIEFTLGEPRGDGFGVRGHGADALLVRGPETLVAASELALAGAHNAANVLAAFALCAAVGTPLAATLPAVRSFRGLPHRMQLVAETSGVRWIDDSKGTNVGATVAAVRGLDGPFVLIAGGLGKGADFTPLADSLCGRARAVVLIGADAPRIEAALAGCCHVEHATSLDDAVGRAGALAEAGDVVLLSPACASQDMFVDYADRGDQFARAVRSRPA